MAAAVGLLVCATAGQAAKNKPFHRDSSVCGSTKDPCKDKSMYCAANDIPFVIASDVDPDHLYRFHYSEPFYAVILEHRPVKRVENPDDPYDCQGYYGVSERDATQKLFPDNRVFSTSFMCESRVTYTNTSDNFFYLAVYAGKNWAQAAKVLAVANQHGKWKSAGIRRMQAGHHFGCLH